MENCGVPIHLRDHDYCIRRRSSARLAGGLRTSARCPCCREGKVPECNPKRHRSASPANPPQKRKRTSVAPPETSPQPSAPEVCPPHVLGLVPTASSATIDPAELPVASNVAPSDPQPSTAAEQDDAPLTIHNHSVEDYQKIYHEVVDDMLRYKNGKPRPYSLELGRRIKQKLWERLNRPTLVTSFTEFGQTSINFSYGAELHPPQYDVDVSEEPKPMTKRH